MDAFSSIRDLLGQILPASEPEAAEDAPAHIPSGIAAVDGELGGWRSGEVVLVGGDSGVGKSAFVYGAALHAAVETGVAVALVPLKHSLATCVGRLVCALAGVSILRYLRSAVDDEERGRLARAARELEASPLLVHDASELTFADLAEHLRRTARPRGVRLLVLDGLPALQAEGAHAGRGERVAALTLELRALAAELEIAVLATVDALALPMLLSAAHHALLLERAPGDDPSRARVRLLGGEPRTIALRFDRETLRFGDG